MLSFRLGREKNSSEMSGNLLPCLSLGTGFEHKYSDSNEVMDDGSYFLK